MSSEKTLGVEIQRIRDRLRAMRTEREAVMHRLVESREHAEKQRHVRGVADGALDADPSPETPPVYAP